MPTPRSLDAVPARLLPSQVTEAQRDGFADATAVSLAGQATPGRPFPAHRVCRRSATTGLERDVDRRRHDSQPRRPVRRHSRGPLAEAARPRIVCTHEIDCVTRIAPRRDWRHGAKNLLAAGRHVDRVVSASNAGTRGALNAGRLVGPDPRCPRGRARRPRSRGTPPAAAGGHRWRTASCSPGTGPRPSPAGPQTPPADAPPAAGVRSPLHRQAHDLVAARRQLEPARDIVGIERLVRLVRHQAGSVPRCAGLLEVGPPPVRRRREC